MPGKSWVRHRMARELLPIVMVVGLGAGIAVRLIPAVIDRDAIAHRTFEGYGVVQDLVLSQGILTLAE